MQQETELQMPAHVLTYINICPMCTGHYLAWISIYDLLRQLVLSNVIDCRLTVSEALTTRYNLPTLYWASIAFIRQPTNNPTMTSIRQPTWTYWQVPCHIQQPHGSTFRLPCSTQLLWREWWWHWADEASCASRLQTAAEYHHRAFL